MLRFIQEVNTTTRSCALWDLEEDTEYIVHVQSISMRGTSPPSDPVIFRTPREAEKLASKSPGKVFSVYLRVYDPSQHYTSCHPVDQEWPILCRKGHCVCRFSLQLPNLDYLLVD